MPDPDDHSPPGPDTGASVTIDSDGNLKGVDVSVGGHGPAHIDLGSDHKPAPPPGWTPNLNPPDPIDLHDLRPLHIPPHQDPPDDGSGTIPSGPYVTDPFSGQDYDPLSHPHVSTVPPVDNYQPDTYSPDSAPAEPDPGVEPPAPEGWE